MTGGVAMSARKGKGERARASGHVVGPRVLLGCGRGRAHADGLRERASCWAKPEE
jgi:hypothetical protein